MIVINKLHVELKEYLLHLDNDFCSIKDPSFLCRYYLICKSKSTISFQILKLQQLRSNVDVFKQLSTQYSFFQLFENLFRKKQHLKPKLSPNYFNSFSNIFIEFQNLPRNTRKDRFGMNEMFLITVILYFFLF